MPDEKSDYSDNDARLLLKEITGQLKVLQDSLIDRRLSFDQTQEISALIGQCNHVASVELESKERLLKHFDFAAAQRNPNEILPFSPITGYYNPVAPDINVEFNPTTKELTAQCTIGRTFEGPPGMVHGGTISGVYDQILAMCATCNQLPGPTATLTIEYLKPTPLHQPLLFTCKIKQQEGRKIFIEGHCVANGEIVSKANGLFILFQG